MRSSSNSGQKTPRVAVKPEPIFSRSISSNSYGIYDSQQSRDRLRSNQSSRFRDSEKKSDSGSLFVNTGNFKDENNKSISIIAKKRNHRRQNSAAVVNIVPHVNPAQNPVNFEKENFKVIDLGFLSPQARQIAKTCVFKTSIDLATPRVTPVICAEILSNNNLKVPLAEQFLNRPETPVQVSKHQRTQSTQIKTRAQTTSEKVLTTATNTNTIPTECSRNLWTEIDSEKGRKSRPSQKENNEKMYKKLVESQLSP